MPSTPSGLASKKKKQGGCLTDHPLPSDHITIQPPGTPYEDGFFRWKTLRPPRGEWERKRVSPPPQRPAAVRNAPGSFDTAAPHSGASSQMVFGRLEAGRAFDRSLNVEGTEGFHAFQKNPWETV